MLLRQHDCDIEAERANISFNAECKLNALGTFARQDGHMADNVETRRPQRGAPIHPVLSHVHDKAKRKRDRHDVLAQPTGCRELEENCSFRRRLLTAFCRHAIGVGSPRSRTRISRL